MKTKSLRFKKAMRAALFVLLLGAVGMKNGYAWGWRYDFCAICETGQTLYYNITDATSNHVELTAPGRDDEFEHPDWEGFIMPIGDITLPSIVDFEGVSYTVASIGEYAFNGCSGLTGNLIIPDSVTSIGDYAFNGCSGLTSLGIPNSVTWMGYHSFYGTRWYNQQPDGILYLANFCLGYKGQRPIGALNILEGTKMICRNAFYGCSGLTGELIIPNSVISIDEYAFYGCNGLTSLTIGDSVTSIGSGAFRGCSELTGDLIIPNSVISIDEYAFYGCNGLTSLTIGNSVTSIGNGAFDFCFFTDVYYLGDLSQWCNITFGEYYYANPFYWPINHNLYIDNSLVTDLIIPETVTSIGNYAFSGCSGLTSLTIPNSVTSIGSAAFSGCSGLTSLTIPNSVTSIGNYAFSGCSGLTSLTIPNSVTSIGNNAFQGTGWYNNQPYGVLYLSNCCLGYKGPQPMGALNIIEGTRLICNSAFSGCNGLIEDLVIPNSVVTIGSYAFSGCSGFNSLTLGNSVTEIGNNAFNGCNGLYQVVCYAETPPALGWSVFGYNNMYNTIVNVPCGALEAYSSISWGGFHYFSEMVCATITLSANPEEGGTVTGGGTYSENSICTVTATANEGYVFVSWTVDGEVVSTEARYGFVVSSDRTLVANFEPVQLSNHWTPVPSGMYSNSTIIQGVIQINGVEQYTDQLELGAFCGEECRGMQRATYFPPTGRYVIPLMVFGENNDVISFRLYDHQQQQELPLTPPADVIFNANGYGSLSAPYILNFTSSPIQTRTFTKGWNWYSTYIEQEDIDGLGQLENSIGIPNVLIQSKGSGKVKSGVQNGTVVWRGNLSSVNNEEMYKIGTKVACTATMEGQVANPANHPIPIHKGWNWIGFPCDHSVSVNDALSGFTPKNGDVVKGINSYTAYYTDGTYSLWYGTLNTLEPGQGYMYGSKSIANKLLVFQTGNRGEATLANVTPENNYYQPATDYADNMTVIAVVELDGEELRSEGYELAAFAGDECRGSVKLMYVEAINRYVAFLTVFGDEAEDLHFVLTDGTDMSLSVEFIPYETDGMLGSLSEPVTLHFGTTDVNENASANVRVYPNPSKDVFNVEGVGVRKVEVTNAYGQVILSEEVENDNLQINLSGKAAGAYLLRVVTDRGVATKKLVKE